MSRIESARPGRYAHLVTSTRPRRHRLRSPLPLTPVADIALLIFFFFLSQASFVVQPARMVELPIAPFQSGIQYGDLVVTVSQEGLIFFNDERILLEGLDNSLAAAHHLHPDAPLLIEADKRVSYGLLMEIQNKAVFAGIKEVALASQLPPPPPEPSP